jgi:hypothetical protein
MGATMEYRHGSHTVYKIQYHFAFVTKYRYQEGLPFRLTDYLELVDWIGRILREDKRGYIAQEIPPILERPLILPSETYGLLSSRGCKDCSACNA